MLLFLVFVSLTIALDPSGLGLFRRPPPNANARIVVLPHGSECRFFNAQNLSDSSWLGLAYDDSSWRRHQMPIGNSTALVNTVIKTSVLPAVLNHVRIPFNLTAEQAEYCRRFGLRLQFALLLNPKRIALNGVSFESRFAPRVAGGYYWNNEIWRSFANATAGPNMLAFSVERFEPDPSIFFVDVQILIDTHLVGLASVFSIVKGLPADSAWRMPGFNETAARNSVVTTWTKVQFPLGFDNEQATNFAKFGYMLPNTTDQAIAARIVVDLPPNMRDLFESFKVRLVADESTFVFINGVEVIGSLGVKELTPAYWNVEVDFNKFVVGENVIALEIGLYHPGRLYSALVIEGIPRDLVSGSVTVGAPTPPPPPPTTTTTGAANAVSPTAVDLPLIIGVSLGGLAFLLLVILVSIVCYQRRTREPPAKPLSQHPREMVSAQDRGYDRVIDPDAAQYDLIPKRMASNEGEYVGPPMTNYSQVPMERISTMADYQQPPMERASTSTSAAFSEYGAPPTAFNTFGDS
jgi:hypothetical protein